MDFGGYLNCFSVDGEEKGGSIKSWFKSVDSGARLPGFEYWLYNLLARLLDFIGLL